MGEFAQVVEKMETALDKPGQPVKRGTMAHDHDVYMQLTDAAGQRRDEKAIRRYAPVLEQLALRDDHQLYRAIADRAWGIAHRLAGEYEEARSRLDRALDRFNSLETPWQIGLTLFELGELFKAMGQPASAGDYFSQALSRFEKIKAAPDAKRARAALESTG